MDSDTGRDVWVYRTNAAILHACAVDGGKVVFGDAGHADLFYIRKLVLCIEAGGSTRWEPADARGVLE